MRTLKTSSTAVRWSSVGLAAAVLAGFQGCNLDKQTIPALSGPSELALSLLVTADPDFVIANDGIDSTGQSTITANLRDQNGQPLSGHGLVFDILDDQGRPADQGKLSSETASTNGSGVATVTYFSPARTDFTADSSILIGVRPLSNDANGQVYRTVRIEVRSPEPRTFPQIPGNLPPTCNFTVQPFPGPLNGAYPTGMQVLFQSTSSDSDGFIVRYEWDFGDNTLTDDQPDVNHVWSVAGTYSVTHTVTDNGGLQVFCSFAIAIQ